jgi:hypothetical protein
MLTGKFHSHITISAEGNAAQAAKLVGGKLTVIDLAKGKRGQTDVMITRHYVTGYHGLRDENDIVFLLKGQAAQLKESGIEVLRTKLEHEMLHEQSNPLEIEESLNRIYTEVHVKCVLAANLIKSLVGFAKPLCWHPSRNSLGKTEDGRLIHFVNRRFYSKPLTLGTLDMAVQELIGDFPAGIEIREIKYESTVFDTNELHDKWWMAG